MIVEVFNLIQKNIMTKDPDDIEIRSVATILHSFYNGLEKIFILILENYHEDKPKGGHSHKKTLKILSSKNAQRNFFLNNEFIDKLEDYLAFRHF